VERSVVCERDICAEIKSNPRRGFVHINALGICICIRPNIDKCKVT